MTKERNSFITLLAIIIFISQYTKEKIINVAM